MTLSPERRFRAALVQLRSGRSMEANLERAEALVRRAAQGGAVYVQTPENTAVMELKPELVLRAAQTEDESVALAKLRALAAELGIFLHIGSLKRCAREAPSARRRARHFSPYRLACHQGR